MKIKKLNIKNFKGILNADIQLGDLTVITGKNSSGKSSLIQSIKYITQWLNRVETTRGLNQFSAPGLNVYHPDFITENLRYDAIKNSKSSKGVSLGIEYENDLSSKYNPIAGQHNEIQIDLEKASQKGEIARLKNIKINNEWLDKTQEDEQFYSIYSDETDADLTELRRKYINGYSLGIFDPKNTREFAKDYFPDTLKHNNKDESLHTLWNYDPSLRDLIDPIKKLILTEVPDSKREEALIINKKGERLMFQKNPFEILESTGYQHYFINFFFDYVHKSHIKDLDKEEPFPEDIYFPTSEFYEDLFQLISNIYKKNYDKKLLDYFNQNIPINMSEKELKELESSFMGPYSNYPLKEGLDLEYLEVLREQLPKDVFNEFKKLTKLINNTTKYKDKADKHAEKRVGHAQCVLMFIYFLNNLMNSKNAIDLNKHIDELVSDNDMLTGEGPSKSVLERPVQSIIELQNLLAKAAKAIGYTAWDKAYLKWLTENEQMHCLCPAENNFDPMGGKFREIERNEIILTCEFNPMNEHVYSLTTPQEQKDLTPNDYTLQPYVNLRGLEGRNILHFLKNFLSEKLSENTIYDTSGTADKRLLFFGSLLKDDSKKVDYGKQAKSFLTTKKTADSLRERILDIEKRENKYKTNLKRLERDLKMLRDSFAKYKAILSNDLSSEDRNKLNNELSQTETQRLVIEDERNSYYEDLNIIEKEKSKLLLQLKEINVTGNKQSKKVDSRKLERLVAFIDTLFTPLVGYQSKSISVAELSKDIKFLNNGRNPTLKEQAGVFNENLTVGKFGGLLPNLMFTQSEEVIDPYLFPSTTATPPFDRSFEELDWYILSLDNTFLESFNEWVSYLEMEISQVESVMDGPNPLLKVQGKDEESRNIFEVGSGVAQVLPVIAICLLAKPGEVVCIEEPESNLHPSAQAYLADFLLSMAISGRQIIIETHSPNIIDRLRLRKAHKKSWKKLKNFDWVDSSLSMDKYNSPSLRISQFSEPEINIIFAEQSSEGNSEYREAILDNNGDIIFDGSSEELWPKGFFDNTQEELSNILKARIYSEEE